MYVLDQMLFPFEVLVENYSEEDKIFQIISKVNPSQIDQYYFNAGCGRRPSDRKAIFRALILKRLMGLVTVKSLRQCLSYSPILGHWCGFDITRKLPSESTFSRFGTELAEMPELRDLLGQTAENLAAEILSITGSKGQAIVTVRICLPTKRLSKTVIPAQTSDTAPPLPENQKCFTATKYTLGL